MKEFEQDIQACVEVLRRGGLILYPTDTIWGIGCDATNADAVQRVYGLKHRSDNKALIVLLDSEEHLDHYVVDVPEMAYELMSVAGILPPAVRAVRPPDSVNQCQCQWCSISSHLQRD